MTTTQSEAVQRIEQQARTIRASVPDYHERMLRWYERPDGLKRQLTALHLPTDEYDAAYQALIDILEI